MTHSDDSLSRPLRVLSILEAASVNGPAKAILEFAQAAHAMSPRPIHLSTLTFQRGFESEFSPWQEGVNLFSDSSQQRGVDTYLVGERRPFDMKTVSGIRKAIEFLKPDIIESHMVKSHLLVSLAGGKRKARWIAFHHGYSMADRKERMYNRLNYLLLRRPHRIISVADAFTDHIRKCGVPSDRITVLHNAINLSTVPQLSTEMRESSRNQLGIRPDEKIIVSVGRLCWEKGQVHLVHAMKILLERGWVGKLRLILVGDGHERPVIESAIQDEGIGNSVILTGLQTNIWPYMAAGDVMAMPSLSEGSPLALLEAMAFGIPSVVTSVGGVPEHVTDGITALVAPPADPSALADRIERMLKNSELAAGIAHQARQHVETNYDTVVRAGKLLAIYDELLSSRRT